MCSGPQSFCPCCMPRQTLRMSEGRGQGASHRANFTNSSSAYSEHFWLCLITVAVESSLPSSNCCFHRCAPANVYPSIFLKTQAKLLFFFNSAKQKLSSLALL